MNFTQKYEMSRFCRQKRDKKQAPPEGGALFIAGGKKPAFEASRQKEGNHAEHGAGFNRQA